MSDNQTLFDIMDIPYHEWFSNVVGGWVYKYGRLNELGPFAIRRDWKNGKYFFRCGDDSTFYILVDDQYESVVLTYTWNNGKEAECNSVYLTKQELSFGEEHCYEVLWQLTKPSNNFHSHVRDPDYAV